MTTNIVTAATGPETGERDPQEPIGGMHVQARTPGTFEYQQLVPERKRFGLQRRSGSNHVSQAREEGQETAAWWGSVGIVRLRQWLAE